MEIINEITSRTWSYLCLAAVVYLIGHIWVYPTFISPLRHLPTIKYSVCTVSLFYSRKASLKWIRQLPNSGLIHIYDIIFGRSCMLICSHAAMLEVLSNTSDYEKPYGLRQFLSGVLGNGLVAAEEGAIHRQDRRLQSPAFTAKNVRQLHSVIWAQTTILLQQIQTKAEEHPRPVDIIDWMHRFSLDAIAQLATGHALDSLIQPGLVPATVSSITEPSLAKLSTAFTWIFLPWLAEWFPWRTLTLLRNENHALFLYCCGVIKQARSTVSEKQEYQHLLSAVLASAEVSDEEAANHLMTTLLAGSETIANTIVRCCDQLCRDPVLQNRLRAEIRSHLPSPAKRTVSAAQLESLPLLNSVCEEVLRLYPAIPMTMRITLRDTTIQGERIPKGTHIFVDFHALNRSRDIWGTNGDDFVPERWLDDTLHHRFVNHQGRPHLAFSSGHRSCIGREVARAELRCTIAGLVGRFAMELVHPDRDFYEAGSISMRSVQKIDMRLRPIEGW